MTISTFEPKRNLTGQAYLEFLKQYLKKFVIRRDRVKITGLFLL